MISVPNRPQPLSGNKLFTIAAVLLTLGACSPKVSALRSPSQQPGQVSTNLPEGKDQGQTTTDRTAKELEDNLNKEYANSIALVLPFQLNQITESLLGEKDVKRSALALDYYQGFQMGLDELAAAGNTFALHVLDSRDNDFQNTALAQSQEVKKASLIVGPVYPKEIRVFGNNLSNSQVLHVNPLAASMPSEFNMPNLVSLTPSIRVHATATAKQAAKEYQQGDVILIYNTNDSDGRQFLMSLSSTIKQEKPQAQVYSVSTVTQLNEKLTKTGRNFIITGTTDKFQIKTLLNNLDKQYVEDAYSFKIFGHPLWDRIDFSSYPNFANYSPLITSESNLKTWTSAVKAFRVKYHTLFGVNPSDHTYKGYDTAIFFGQLIAKYGDRYAEHLTTEKYTGIFNSYDFSHNTSWGYVNNAVSFKVYSNSSFQLQ